MAAPKDMNKFVECVFGVTLRPNGTGLLNVKEFCSEDTELISLEMLEQLLFERLLIADNIESYLIGPSPRDNHIIETECITYLNECFNRLYNDNVKSLVDNDSYKQVKDLIIRNICTASLTVPHNIVTEIDVSFGFRTMVDIILVGFAMFASFPLSLDPILPLLNATSPSQFQTFLCTHMLNVSHLQQFTTLFSHIVADFIQTEDPAEVDSLLLSAFQPLLNQVSKDFRSASLLLLPMHHFDLLLCFASIEKLATTLIQVSQVKHSNENEPPPGYLFEETLFGSMLNISCLPKHHQIHAPMSVFNEFFSKPHEYTPSILQTIEGKIWFGLDNLLNNAHKIFHTILKTKNIAVRNQLLVWIGDCLNSNAKRGSIHLRGLHKETCLLPHDAEAPRPKPRAPLTFITECYWLTHRSLDLSTRVMLDQLNRTHQELARIQATYLDAMNNPDHPMTQHVREALSLKTSKYIAYRTVLLHPTTLSLLTQFQLCTCVYLVQLLLNVDQSESSDTTVTSHAPLMMRPVSFPLPEKITPVLNERVIPGFKARPSCSDPGYLFEETLFGSMLNISCLPKHHQIHAPMSVFNEFFSKPHEYTPSILQTIEGYLFEETLFGSMLNISCLPKHHQIHAPMSVFNEFFSKPHELFTEHPHRVHIVRSLLDIFVGIEMTGESVEFEQKFNYRRPMYAIMRFLWSLDEHRRQFVRLARVAEENMHSDRPPLFLRFVNLLMNDAVFLLDEALSNMAQIRTMQTAQENGEWAALPPREQAQNQGFLQHIGMMARFDNILGNETIHTLEYLTSEIRSIFCHSTMVDRIAAMLNYFLFHLVGPKMRNFKVKHFVIDNLWSFLYLIRHHKVYHLEEAGTPLLEPSLTCVLAYMGTNRRIRNPHLRARLAECLECMLPLQPGDEQDMQPGGLNRNLLGNIARTKDAAMMSIRRKIMGQTPAQIKEIKQEDIDLPVTEKDFREAIARCRKSVTAHDLSKYDSWMNEFGFLQHIGMMARFDNILGNETIHTLEYLTSEIRSIFCHSTMVDRIAAMLNYFLFHLVGPKMRNFKRKLKLNISTSPYYYFSLSLPPSLLYLARIGGASLIPDLRRVAVLVEKLGAQLQSDEALLAGAPDEYLDPIMNTIMLEPVTLPSSRQTLDKSTIARHLLSDQTDPFNRSPLTMEQVIPNTQLQTQIQDWIRQCRQKSLASKSADTTSKSGETESESARSPDHSASQTSSSDGREIQSESEAASKPEDTQSQSALAADPNSIPPSSASDESK
ncbi:ubiquitin conjugation factor E4 A-like [Diaphorina citri]|uniref:Ubiquitin conjugation factor E4 A n=1 Tax=Diaphorina citri TaxID=121845 RepID=A0A3Q0J8J3_DIACI|nr:ubiquitin conjugation factor E4 A-like [Diaphorina citri]